MDPESCGAQPVYAGGYDGHSRVSGLPASRVCSYTWTRPGPAFQGWGPGLPTFSLVTAALTLRLASRVLIPIPALRRDRD